MKMFPPGTQRRTAERHFQQFCKDIHRQQLADWGDGSSPKPFCTYCLPQVLLMVWQKPALSHRVWRRQQDPEAVEP